MGKFLYQHDVLPLVLLSYGSVITGARCFSDALDQCQLIPSRRMLQDGSRWIPKSI